MKHVPTPTGNFDACKEAYLNENKIFRDIGKGVDLKHISIDEKEQANKVAVVQGFLSDNKVFKEISTGPKKKLRKAVILSF